MLVDISALPREMLLTDALDRLAQSQTPLIRSQFICFDCGEEHGAYHTQTEKLIGHFECPSCGSKHTVMIPEIGRQSVTLKPLHDA